MDVVKAEEIYHSIRALSSRLFISPFTWEVFESSLKGGYTELLAQILSSLVYVSERGHAWSKTYERELSDNDRPKMHAPDFSPVVTAGVVAMNLFRIIRDQKKFECLERLARVEDRFTAPREVLYACRGKAENLFKGELGINGGKVDFWELGAAEKLEVLGELHDYAVSTSRVREYLEHKATGTFTLDRPGEDGSMEKCVLCDCGGDLVCCGKCPRTFHSRCLNVSRRQLGTREEDWICPECKVGRHFDNDVFEYPRLPKIGTGSESQEFWLGDGCIIEGVAGEGEHEAGRVQIHRGVDLQHIFFHKITNLSDDEKVVEQAERMINQPADSTPCLRGGHYVNHYVHNGDPCARTGLDNHLKQTRLLAKKHSLPITPGMPARFRYRPGDGPEGFCKSYVLMLEKVVGIFQKESWWPSQAKWVDSVKKCTESCKCGQLLIDFLENMREEAAFLNWEELGLKEGYPNRKDHQQLSLAYYPRGNSHWEYYRGKAARIACVNRIPKKEVRKLARSGGKVEVQGVDYRLSEKNPKPIVSMGLQILAAMQQTTCWTVLAEAILSLDQYIKYNRLEPDPSEPWAKAEVKGWRYCTAEGDEKTVEYEVQGAPSMPERTEEVAMPNGCADDVATSNGDPTMNGVAEEVATTKHFKLGDIPLWVVQSFEEQRKKEKLIEAGAAATPVAEQYKDPKDFCGYCNMRDPLYIKDASNPVVDWVCCDKCDQWYHSDCLGEDRGSKKGAWECSRCRPAQEGRRKKTKVSRLSFPQPTEYETPAFPGPLRVKLKNPPFLQKTETPHPLSVSTSPLVHVNPLETPKTPKTPKKKDGVRTVRVLKTSKRTTGKSTRVRKSGEKGRPGRKPKSQTKGASGKRGLTKHTIVLSTRKPGRPRKVNRGRAGLDFDHPNNPASGVAQAPQPLKNDPPERIVIIDNEKRKRVRVAGGWVEFILGPADARPDAEDTAVDAKPTVKSSPVEKEAPVLETEALNNGEAGPVANGDTVDVCPVGFQVIGNPLFDSVAEGSEVEGGSVGQNRVEFSECVEKTEQDEQRDVGAGGNGVVACTPGPEPGVELGIELEEKCVGNVEKSEKGANLDQKDDTGWQRGTRLRSRMAVNCMDAAVTLKAARTPSRNYARRNSFKFVGPAGHQHKPERAGRKGGKKRGRGEVESEEAGEKLELGTGKKLPGRQKGSGTQKRARSAAVTNSGTWRSAAEAALSRLPNCRAWTRALGNGEHGVDVKTIIEELGNYRNPEDVVAAIEKVVHGAEVGPAQMEELLKVAESQWRARGLSWPKTKRKSEDSSRGAVKRRKGR